MEPRRIAVAATDCLSGGGEMGALMRSLDWSRTKLGPVEGWPQSLRTSVSLMLESGFAMVVAWGPEFVFLYNDRYRPILGSTKHPAALGRPAREIFPEVWSFIGPLFEQTRKGEAVALDDVLIPLDRNGYLEECYFLLSYSPIRDESGGVGGMLAVVAETTERVQGERQLATLRDLAALGEARDAEEACARAEPVLAANRTDVPFSILYLLEPDGRHARRAALSGLGRDSLAAPERIALDGSDPWALAQCLASRELQELSGLSARIGVVPGTPYPEPVESAVVMPMVRAGGNELHGFFIAGLNPRRRLDARYRTFFELSRDHVVAAISRAIAREEERKRAEALAAIDRAKTAFFSNVSHEFRTPLTLMLGPMEDALANGGLAGESLEVAHRNALRLQKLVNALLDFSRIEAGRMRATFVPTDLPRMTRDLAAMFESAFARAGLAYRIECDAIAEPIHVDRDMFEKILLNLLSNALKFTFDGEVTVSLRDAGDAVELRVRDTGVGVAASELPRLFERFHRIEGSRARTHEGSGIGLALVSDLVKLHGGSVSADSAPGRGTTFTVRFRKGAAHLPPEHVAGSAEPVAASAFSAAYLEEALRWLPGSDAPGPEAEEPRAPGDEPPAAAATSAPRSRVLVVDDNADMRAYLRRVLERHWSVEVQADGAAALESARRSPPDVVLTDVMMPGLDGFALLREMHADPRLRSVPVVMLSARAGEESRLEGLDAGADDYLVKPFSARELVARVRVHLELARHRRETEESLTRLNELFEQAPAVLALLTGPDHVFRIANAAYHDVVGRQELLGKPIRDALPELEGQGLYELLDRVYRTGEPYVGSERPVKLRRAGVLEDTFFNFVYQPYRGAEGAVQGVVVVASEVTTQVVARRRAEELADRLQKSEQALGAANRAKDEFLAVLGHELRNPLAPIMTAVQLMRLRNDGNTREREVIERQARHLVRLVDDLLDVSRITRGKLELRKARTEMAQVVARAVETASPLLEQRRQVLAVEVPAHGLLVDVDLERIAQVISNLLTNAAKYSEPGGRIRVLAERAGDSVVLRVRDDGIGIEPEMLPRIFDMFVQERQALDRAQGGLGLGLTIVRSLVSLHGGTVEAHSEGRDRGSEFVIRLPACDPKRAATEGKAAGSSASRGSVRSRRILVVDDNEDAAAMLAAALAAIGHEAFVAHDGPEALRLAGEHTPEIALLDIGLPVMDGYELARRLQDRFGRTQLRLVAITGYGQESDRAQTDAAGFHAHLVKPVDLARLETLLAEISKRRGAPARPGA